VTKDLWLYVGVGLIASGVIGLFVGLFLLRRERFLRNRRPPLRRRLDVPDDGAVQVDEEREDQSSEAPDNAFDTFVMGQRETNPDGTDRQDIIATLATGDPLTLRHEPTSFDPNAIAVVAAGGVIGYLPSKQAGELIGVLDETSRARATVNRIVEDEVNQSRVRGVWMHVELWRLISGAPTIDQNEDIGADEKDEAEVAGRYLP
jgi:hypothetical protein